MSGTSEVPFKVVVAGGGTGALECALALSALADKTIDVTVVAPDTTLTMRPQSVQEPFSYGVPHSYELSQVLEGTRTEVIQDKFDWVDAPAQIAHTASGMQLPYDALVLALGARQIETFPEATTINDRNVYELFHGIVQDVEMGYVRSLAFLMPATSSWPLPLYELALMTAQRAQDMGVDISATIFTPERMPLEVFGTDASAAIADLLSAGKIAVETHARCRVPDGQHVIVEPGDRDITVDRVIALPELRGPGVRGIQSDPDGFIPVDDRQRVKGVKYVLAVGDATTFPINHGGLASQQADTAAHVIANLAGVGAEAGPFRPVIHGMVLTGRAPLYLSATVVAGAGFQSEISTEPLWATGAKVDALYLTPRLHAIDSALPLAS
jgi:sulfide:quinone oxidoreductase